MPGNEDHRHGTTNPLKDRSVPSLTVGLVPPRHGWSELSLSDGRKDLVIVLSDVPFDSFGELTSALCGVMEGRPDGIARINSEPEVFELRFETGTGAEKVRLSVVRLDRVSGRPQHEEILFMHEGDPFALGRAFWRALRKIESQFDPAAWKHTFPAKELKLLGDLTRRPGGDPGVR